MTTPAQIQQPMTSPELVLQALNWRYATKDFDPSKKLTLTQWSALEHVLLLTPSSYGLEPWKFVVVSDADLRMQLRKASYGQTKVTDASHFIVFAAKHRIEESDVQKFIELISKTRNVPVTALEEYKQMMIGDIVNGPRSRMAFEWSARQCFIALGNLMTAAAIMGIDTGPMEGFDPAAYDKILNLEAIGYGAAVACAVGFRLPTDKFANIEKVRFGAEEMIIRK